MIEFKEHILREHHNNLKEIAIKYHNFGCLRELIVKEVKRHLEEQNKWLEDKYIMKDNCEYCGEKHDSRVICPENNKYTEHEPFINDNNRDRLKFIFEGLF